jgi:hypothetical protein
MTTKKPSRRKAPAGEKKPKQSRRNRGKLERQKHGGALQRGGTNPGAGHPTSEFQAKCRAALDKIDAIGIASKIARSRKAAARDKLAALAWLADRGHGKPTQPVSGPEGGPIQGQVTVRFLGAKGKIE